MQHAGEESMFVFPTVVDHDRMFEALECIRFGEERDWVRKYHQGQAISAGFIINGICSGRSETLDLNSRDEIDTAIFNNQIER